MECRPSYHQKGRQLLKMGHDTESPAGIGPGQAETHLEAPRTPWPDGNSEERRTLCLHWSLTDQVASFFQIIARGTGVLKPTELVLNLNFEADMPRIVPVRQHPPQVKGTFLWEWIPSAPSSFLHSYGKWTI